MSTTNVGRFVWYELMTTDPKAAIAFYTHVIGWKTEPFAGSTDYTMWVSGQGAVGGVTPLPEAARKMGAGPHWMAHVGVANVDETAAHARKLGGQLLVPPQDVPNVGRFAILADPQGATISAFKEASGSMAAHDITKSGEFCWHELVTSNHDAAFKFYSDVFGWKRLSEMDMGPVGKYVIYGQGTTQYGGMFTIPKDQQRSPAWLYYVEVADLDAAVARAKERGGTVQHGPTPVPSGNRIVQLLDPQGVAFALHGK